ncbi:HlyD family secretion protein [Flavitalea sp.]|nr:HlyD family efflux transporter periplasmic adaptor subunit [Flavitalea sp.]
MSLSKFPEVDLIGHPPIRRVSTIYWAIILFIGSVMILLPIIRVEISVRSPGIIRPDSERTVIRSLIPGIIEELYASEGQFIEKDSLILTLRDNLTQPKVYNIDYELNQKIKFIHDLELLTGFAKTENLENLNISTPLYRRQLGRYIFQLKDQSASISKVRKELSTDSLLYADKVISKNEYFNKDIESQKLIAAFEAFQDEQISTWQHHLSQLRSEVSGLEAQRQGLLQEKMQYEIRAPISGFLQGLASKYKGSLVQAGEIFCELSPETTLIAECFVPTQDIGFLKKNQSVNFQVDAFDHNYFGVIQGKITSIDNDFTILENIPVFKVRCEFKRNMLSLKNGYNGRLKKGLRLQARFIIARRTIAQLLFDKIDDWLNPVAF